MAEFKTPEFLENNDLDTIHDRMMSNLPEDMDVSEGSHPWNLTMPTAYEKAQMVEFILIEAIKTIFPMYSEDHPDIMDYHAEGRGLQRKKAEYAKGEITVTGEPDTEIPKESMFSTVGINDQPSIDFMTTENAKIGVEGTVTIPIKAVQAGTIGNVPAETIILNASEIDDITAVINKAETTGGIEEESTESLQQRILEYDQMQETSYGGSEADYRRWALSVNGTGGADIVHPPDDTTPIKIVLTDANGKPANETLCQQVYDYIMRPDNPIERLAPVNDRIEVIPPSTIKVAVTAIIELADTGSLQQIKKEFVEELQKYMSQAMEVKEIRQTKVAGILSAIPGVADHKDLKVNNKTGNIALQDGQVATISETDVNLNIGTV